MLELNLWSLMYLMWEPPYDLMESCQLEFLGIAFLCMLVVIHDPLASSPMPEKLALAPALTVFVFQYGYSLLR